MLKDTDAISDRESSGSPTRLVIDLPTDRTASSQRPVQQDQQSEVTCMGSIAYAPFHARQLAENSTPVALTMEVPISSVPDFLSNRSAPKEIGQPLPYLPAKRYFRPNSQLKEFVRKDLLDRGNISYNSIEIEVVYTYITTTATRLDLWDRSNKQIIMCGPQLESVLGCRAVHSANLYEIIGRQLVGRDDPLRFIPIVRLAASGELAKIEHHNRIIYHTMPRFPLTLENTPHNPDARFPVAHDVTNFMLDGMYGTFNPTREYAFSKKEITDRIYQHLSVPHIRENLIDHRNPTIVLCQQDILGHILKMNTFHINQIPRIVAGIINTYNKNNLAHSSLHGDPWRLELYPRHLMHPREIHGGGAGRSLSRVSTDLIISGGPQ